MLTQGPAAGPAATSGQVHAVEPDVVIVDAPSVKTRLALAQTKAAARRGTPGTPWPSNRSRPLGAR